MVRPAPKPLEVATPADLGPIVSSGHLASGALPALSEFEFGLILAGHAFERWMVRCMAAAGVPNLSALDVLVLHNVNHRGKAKRLADIAMVLNVEDTHVVNYAVKKLEGLGLVSTGKLGKEKVIAATSAGEAICLRYREIREKLLVAPLKGGGVDPARLSEIAGLMRGLSGAYDQGARAAASL
jgi:predicted MarR family transcription regulator